MRILTAVVVAGLLLSAALPMQAQPCTGDVLKVENRILELTRTGDVDALAGLLAERFVVVNATGRITEREQLLERKAEARRVYKRLEAESLDVRCHGSSAVVVGTAVVEFAPESMAHYSGQYRYIRVYANEQGGWKAISLQLSSIEPTVRP
jgi:ketosteroid isomerase-like protein